MLGGATVVEAVLWLLVPEEVPVAVCPTGVATMLVLVPICPAVVPVVGSMTSQNIFTDEDLLHFEGPYQVVLMSYQLV